MAIEVEVSLDFAPFAHFSSEFTLPTYTNRVVELIARGTKSGVCFFALGAGEY